jgi:ribosomal protein L40E
MEDSMVPPAEKFKRWFKKNFEEFKKTPYAIPAALAIVTGLFYVALLYASAFCMFGLIPPIIMLATFWLFGLKGMKKLILLGLTSCVLFLAVGTTYATNYYMNVDEGVGRSDDGILTDGSLTPLRGDASTVYNYTITVHLDKAPANASVRFMNVTLWGPAHGDQHYVMSVAEQVNETTFVYYYETTLSKPVNAFIFRANITSEGYEDGYEIVFATEYDGSEEVALIGPIFNDGWKVAAYLAPLMAYSTFIVFFPIYAIIIFMIWWTKRARRMREDKLLEWERKRKEEEEAAPKEEVKVPSLAKAMGLEKDDTFVCSECGADVPADATACPKCGEKFE